MRVSLKTMIAAGLLLGSSGAFAADLSPTYKAAAPPAIYNWTGLYAGVNAGYGWARVNANVVGASSTSENLKGFIGGGQLGYNWQSGNWVLGLETDLQGTAQSITTVASAGGITQSETDKLPWFGTTRVRAGLAAGSWLFYGTGGVGYGQFKSDLALSGAVTGTASVTSTKAAWVAGGGVEAAINNSNWTWKVEYLHLESGTVSNTVTIAGATIVSNAKITDDFVRAGLNYRF